MLEGVGWSRALTDGFVLAAFTIDLGGGLVLCSQSVAEAVGLVVHHSANEWHATV